MNSRLYHAGAALALAGTACAQVGPAGEAPQTNLAGSAEFGDGLLPATQRPDLAGGPNREPLFGFSDPPADGKLKFKQIADHVSEGQVLGSDASFNIARLPAAFVTAVGDEICTATLIGPQVLLTAAHCVDAKKAEGGVWQTLTGSATLADGSSGQDIHSCAMAPAYTAAKVKEDTVRNDNDYALCELLLPMKVRAEPISFALDRIAPGRQLLIAGYGCTEQDLTGGVIAAGNPTSGKLHVGTNRVRGGGPNGWINMKGRVGSAQAILCPGDSGGAAYSGASLAEAGGDRGWKVVAVNSAVGPAGGAGEYLSYLSPLADPDFKTFVDAWAAKRPVARQICGLHIDQPGTECRQ